ncbi:hypothetical protein [Laspinema olomoucense]|uniref:hypothetical protein n=1 Tax=Laspinema olomoucense TaxID=3231600 RepID=UPI0021BB3B4A|nr:hypothetical protein [Laspinema sp. D3c]MCT7997179.1 hypothetical protein [Laspinema sp. D3c]
MASPLEVIGQLLPTDRRTERPTPMPSNPKVILLPMEKMGHSFKVIGHSAPNRLQKNGLCVRGDRSIRGLQNINHPTVQLKGGYV